VVSSDSSPSIPSSLFTDSEVMTIKIRRPPLSFFFFPFRPLSFFLLIRLHEGRWANSGLFSLSFPSPEVLRLQAMGRHHPLPPPFFSPSFFLFSGRRNEGLKWEDVALFLSPSLFFSPPKKEKKKNGLLLSSLFFFFLFLSSSQRTARTDIGKEGNEISTELFFLFFPLFFLLFSFFVDYAGAKNEH